MHQDQEIKTTVLSGYQVAIQAGTVCKPDRAIHPAGLFSSSLLLCPFFSHSPLLEFPPLPPTTPSPPLSSLFNTRSQGFHFESIVVGMLEFGKLSIYFDACLKLHVCMYARKWQTLSTGSLWPCSISDV